MAAFSVILPMDPPTCTHHAKTIGVRTSPRTGRRHRTLVDSPELAAAAQAYATMLAASGRRPSKPLAGPLLVLYMFGHADPELTAWRLRQKKPDTDNMQKTIQDALVKAGWIEADERCAITCVVKLDGPRGFVRVDAVEVPELVNFAFTIQAGPATPHPDDIILEKIT